MRKFALVAVTLLMCAAVSAQTTGGPLRVVDANGLFVAWLAGFDRQSGMAMVDLDLGNGERAFAQIVSNTDAQGFSSFWSFSPAEVYFDAANCTGNAYGGKGNGSLRFFDRRVYTVTGPASDGRAFVHPPSALARQYTLQSVLTARGCANGSFTITGEPVWLVATLPSYTAPFRITN